MNLFAWLQALTDEHAISSEDPEPPSSPLLSHRLHDLENVAVRDIMVPRPLVQALDLDVQLKRVKRLKSSPVAFFPVYRGDLDHILGWVSKQKVVELLDRPPEEGRLEELARPVATVLENASVASLADRFLEHASPILIVKGEAGGTVGVVYLADFVELVFGFEFSTLPVHTPGDPAPPPLRRYEI